MLSAYSSDHLYKYAFELWKLLSEEYLILDVKPNSDYRNLAKMFDENILKMEALNAI